MIHINAWCTMTAKEMCIQMMPIPFQNQTFCGLPIKSLLFHLCACWTVICHIHYAYTYIYYYRTLRPKPWCQQRPSRSDCYCYCYVVVESHVSLIIKSPPSPNETVISSIDRSEFHNTVIAFRTCRSGLVW